jgi:hypothetical protein
VISSVTVASLLPPPPPPLPPSFALRNARARWISLGVCVCGCAWVRWRLSLRASRAGRNTQWRPTMDAARRARDQVRKRIARRRRPTICIHCSAWVRLRLRLRLKEEARAERLDARRALELGQLDDQRRATQHLFIIASRSEERVERSRSHADLRAFTGPCIVTRGMVEFAAMSCRVRVRQDNFGEMSCYIQGRCRSIFL